MVRNIVGVLVDFCGESACELEIMSAEPRSLY